MEQRIIDRFWSRIDKNGPVPKHRPELGPCWIWTRSRTSAGYGNISLGTRHEYTHRISWMLHFGDIPTGLHVLHKCDNPPCCRPDHLFIGTHTDNHADCSVKERSGNMKLGNADVLEIRQMALNGCNYGDIAERFRVNRDTIWLIVEGLNRKHVPMLTEEQVAYIRSKKTKRMPIGSKHANAKLTEADVIEIRRRYSNGEHQTKIAKFFGIHQGNVHYIIARKTWTHI